MTRSSAGRIASSAVLAVALAIGCSSSSRPAKVVEASPARRQAPAPVPKEAAAPIEIQTIDLREGAPEVFVDLEATAPLVWTSFRNAQGEVVLELPNAVPASSIGDLAAGEGLVSSLKVTRATDGSRPLTRLVVATRQEVEHSVVADGTRLHLRLQPVEPAEGAERPALAFEPVQEGGAPAAETPEVAEPEPAEPAPAAEAPAPAPVAGTPEQPAVGPAPAGPAATRLDKIEVLASGPGTVVRLAGDGEFPYQTFVLADPDRFVVDLSGVIVHAPRSAVEVAGGVVGRVRVGQFRPLPQPVARVVFDLERAAVPRIERTGDSLVVTFPAGAASMAEAGQPAATVAARNQAPAPPPTQPVYRGGEIQVEEAPEAPAPQRPAGGAATQPSDITLRAPTLQMQSADGQLTPATQGFAPQDLGSTQSEKAYFGEPIDLKVTNAEVTDVLRTFAQLSGLNIIVQPGVTGTVTAEMENVPWDQALEQVLRINKLGFELEGNVMRIAPTTVLREEAQERQELAKARALAIPLRTVMKRLNYADASGLAGLLRSGQAGLLSQRGSVIVDDRTNTLIIKELPTFIDAVLNVVEMLDTPEPQVMIEARIIETTKRFTRDLGIRWGFEGTASGATGNTTGLVFPNNLDVAGDVEVGGSTNDVLRLRLGNVLNTFQLDVALQAAETEGLINILSAPKVATLNNQRASIQSGLQIPIQTIANNTVTVQYVNATLRLDVTPQVTAEGTILMDIDISKREPQIAFLVPGATNAPIATKDARTRVVVRDGGTAVIGGIYEVSSDEGQDRIPGLANIPILGNLFKNKSQRDENEELLIFITPRIIKI